MMFNPICLTKEESARRNELIQDVSASLALYLNLGPRGSMRLEHLLRHYMSNESLKCFSRDFSDLREFIKSK